MLNLPKSALWYSFRWEPGNFRKKMAGFNEILTFHFRLWIRTGSPLPDSLYNDLLCSRSRVIPTFAPRTPCHFAVEACCKYDWDRLESHNTAKDNLSACQYRKQTLTHSNLRSTCVWSSGHDAPAPTGTLAMYCCRRDSELEHWLHSPHANSQSKQSVNSIPF